jgi:hypothetical protein
VKAVQQAGSAAGELGDALTGERAARATRVSRALGLARDAESSTRASVQSISDALGTRATLAAHAVPVIGQIIAALLIAIAAITVLIATILEKATDRP